MRRLLGVTSQLRSIMFSTQGGRSAVVLPCSCSMQSLMTKSCSLEWGCACRRLRPGLQVRNLGYCVHACRAACQFSELAHTHTHTRTVPSVAAAWILQASLAFPVEAGSARLPANTQRWGLTYWLIRNSWGVVAAATACRCVQHMKMVFKRHTSFLQEAPSGARRASSGSSFLAASAPRAHFTPVAHSPPLLPGLPWTPTARRHAADDGKWDDGYCGFDSDPCLCKPRVFDRWPEYCMLVNSMNWKWLARSADGPSWPSGVRAVVKRIVMKCYDYVNGAGRATENVPAPALTRCILCAHVPLFKLDPLGFFVNSNIWATCWPRKTSVSQYGGKAFCSSSWILPYEGRHKCLAPESRQHLGERFWPCSWIPPTEGGKQFGRGVLVFRVSLWFLYHRFADISGHNHISACWRCFHAVGSTAGDRLRWWPEHRPSLWHVPLGCRQ